MNLAVYVCFMLISLCSSATNSIDFSLNKYWNSYKSEFSKSYQSLEEEFNRRLIWESNLKYINNHNSEASLGKHTFTLKMNKFGDLTQIEYKQKYLMKTGVKPKVETKVFHPDRNAKIPTSVDWRENGLVTPVSNQLQCGSCWAFSALAALEGQHYKYFGKLVNLSAQNLLDCDMADYGCSGGFMETAYDYIIKNGIDTNESYPYTGAYQTCKFNSSAVGANLKSYAHVKNGSEEDLTIAIARIGPIAATIDASQASFAFYHSGVYSDPNCSSVNLDHTFTAVGYDSLNGTDYYIVKNSWGTDWGDKGYILFGRNQNNMCGIASATIYPIL